MNSRGELWFTAQIVLLTMILGQIEFAPDWADYNRPEFLRIIGWTLFVPGMILTFGAVLSLAENYTVFPKPASYGTFVERGVFRIVRHPMYIGMIFLSWSIALVVTNWIGFPLALAWTILHDLKSRREDRWLVELFPAYEEYRSRVKRFIPWIY